MRVVTAAILEENGRVFIARRKPGGHMGGKWEFPGGKVEPGEKPEQALRRELAEELGISARVGELLGAAFFEVDGKRYQLLAYRAVIISGEPVRMEHEEFRWVDPGDLGSYDLADSDRRVARDIFG